MTPLSNFNFVLEIDDIPRLANLCGPMNQHIHQLEKELGVKIFNQGHHFSIQGEKNASEGAIDIIKALYASTKEEQLTSDSIHLYLYSRLQETEQQNNNKKILYLRTPRCTISLRNGHQASYLEHIRACDLTFGVGPAGTGKTYIAAAAAVESLNEKIIEKLVLVRPAVEAGEQLGFLPGDLAQKIDPYLRPLYDALYDILGNDTVHKLVHQAKIEIAPLAYMRGRSLNGAFIILDEAQNTTIEQMKMFLTRIGANSKAVVTGDVTQVDLPQNKQSGLKHALKILKNIQGIGFSYFDAGDVVRHRLVRKILKAYDEEMKTR